MQEITIMTRNRIGALAEVCELLGKNGVNIESISAHGEGDSGLIRLVTGDTATVERALSKSGYSYRAGDILIVKLNDSPGELGKIARKLSNKGIDIESIYLLSRNRGITEIAIKPGNYKAALAAIK